MTKMGLKDEEVELIIKGKKCTRAKVQGQSEDGSQAWKQMDEDNTIRKQ